MPLPSGTDYSNAVQNPQRNFEDTDLKLCKVENTQLGIPKPYSGGFTTTFKLCRNTHQWAVRCFTREVKDLKTRYQAMGLLTQSGDPFVSATCLMKGIKANNEWHPIIKMEWVVGEPLNRYIETNRRDYNRIQGLRQQFVDLIDKLGQLGIAHGDLQHGNIIVHNEQLRLIDYDGMYIPQLSHLKTSEIGHVNYQHPSRNETHYDNTIDRFSSIVIYLGLSALLFKPDLWDSYDNGENILFKQEDFHNPDTSKLLRDLARIHELAAFIDPFRRVCLADFENVPSLNDLLAGKAVDLALSIRQRPSRRQYSVIDASDRNELQAHIGRKVVVIGLIDDGHGDMGRNGAPYLFLNFGRYPIKTTLTLVFWANILDVFWRKKIDPEKDYKYKWVQVTGVLSEYQRRPQIEVESPSDIEVLPKEEAERRLRGEISPVEPVRAPDRSPDLLPRRDVEILNSLYGRGIPTPSTGMTASRSTGMPSSTTAPPSLPVSPTPISGKPAVPPVVTTPSPKSSPPVPITQRSSSGGAQVSPPGSSTAVRPSASPSTPTASPRAPQMPATRSQVSISQPVTTSAAPQTTSAASSVSPALGTYVASSPVSRVRIWVREARTRLSEFSDSVILTFPGLSWIVAKWQRALILTVCAVLLPILVFTILSGKVPFHGGSKSQPSLTVTQIEPTSLPTPGPQAFMVTRIFIPSVTPSLTPIPSSTTTMTDIPSRTPTLTPTATVTSTSTPTLTPSPTHMPTSTVARSNAVPPTAYVIDATQRVNARSCPRFNCEIWTRLSPGQIILVTKIVDGDLYENSSKWYQFAHDGRRVYVHSSLATPE